MCSLLVLVQTGTIMVVANSPVVGVTPLAVVGTNQTQVVMSQCTALLNWNTGSARGVWMLASTHALCQPTIVVV